MKRHQRCVCIVMTQSLPFPTPSELMQRTNGTCDVSLSPCSHRALSNIRHDRITHYTVKCLQRIIRKTLKKAINQKERILLNAPISRIRKSRCSECSRIVLLSSWQCHTHSPFDVGIHFARLHNVIHEQKGQTKQE